MARDTSKLTVRLSPEIVAVLQELAGDSGATMTDVIKKSISDRKYFVDKLKDGNEIVLEKTDPSTSDRTRTIVDLR